MMCIKRSLAGLALVSTIALSGCAPGMVPGGAVRSSTPAGVQLYTASNELRANADKDKPGKGNPSKKSDDKGKSEKGKQGQGQADATGNGQGNGQSPPGQGIGRWWRDFASRLLGKPAADSGGWQLGRFKDAFPFAYPPGWVVRERGDAVLMTGNWQDSQYLFQMTRSVAVGRRSLEEWVTADLPRMGASAASIRYAQVNDVQVAVVTGVRDPEYSCPVAYVYLWTANPAGRNQRQALGVVSQAADMPCDPAALSAFTDAYLDKLGADSGPAPAATVAATPAPTMRAPTVSPTAPPATATPSAGGNSGWQRTRFFNAFSFSYPQGWTMERLGDTAHLQGEYQGRLYVTDMLWVRDAPQVGLEQWARADLEQLGVDLQGVRIDYAPQGDEAQIAIVTGIRLPGYDCPVVRMYVVAHNAAGGGERSYAVTMAQANGQACNQQALESVAYQMIQQA